MSDVTLNLFVSEKIRAQVEAGSIKNLQATVPHANVVALLGLAGLPESTTLSKKQGRMLDVTVRTPKGSEVTFRQGDTHAVWYVHQTDENAKKLLEYAGKKGGVSFPVEGVVLVNSDAPKAAVGDMADCPL